MDAQEDQSQESRKFPGRRFPKETMIRCDHRPAVKSMKDGYYPNCVKCGVPITEIPGWYTIREAERMQEAMNARVIVTVQDVNKETGDLTT
jgi:hypothetical protein